MSSIKSKKSKLSGESLEIEKSRIIYDRLKRAYLKPGERSDGNLGKLFGGMSKQAIGQRKSSGNYDPQEIFDLFPAVNKDWIFSNDLESLRTLPVKDPRIQKSNATKQSRENLLNQRNVRELSLDDLLQTIGSAEDLIRKARLEIQRRLGS